MLKLQGNKCVQLKCLILVGLSIRNATDDFYNILAIETWHSETDNILKVEESHVRNLLLAIKFTCIT